MSLTKNAVGKKSRARRLTQPELEVALDACKFMARYRYKVGRRYEDRPSATVWDQRNGDYVRNPLRQLPEAVERQMDRIMDKYDPEGGHGYIYNVDPHYIWSFQRSLVLRNLLRVVRKYNASIGRPLNKHVVTCLRYKNKLIMWNGNHRAVASLMLGRRLNKVRIIDLKKLVASGKKTKPPRVVKVKAKRK